MFVKNAIATPHVFTAVIMFLNVTSRHCRDASSRGASAHGHYTMSAIFFRCHSAKLEGRSEAHGLAHAGAVPESKCETAYEQWDRVP